MDGDRLPKRLIEVDLPIKKISAHARREKSIRHGHISTLHFWWARRPLAACRAVILATLWPDPADESCPERLRKEAALRLRLFRDKVGGKERNWSDPKEVREALLDFIADFANWDNSNEPLYLETSRALVQVAHEALGGEPGTRPLVVDPFAGGGAIPLEALRVGADAFASDLNPVAVLLNKVVLEYIPKYGQRLAEEVRKWGAWVKKEAEKQLAEYYPKDPDGATPIAYLWARTIKCEGPGCGAELPLIRTLWLSKKAKRPTALRVRANAKTKEVDFEVVEQVASKDVAHGTQRLGAATCPVCAFVTGVDRVRKQLSSRRGGAFDARLFCVVTLRPGESRRFYRVPTKHDLCAEQAARAALAKLPTGDHAGLSLLPDEPTPNDGTGSKGGGYRTRKYGIERFGDFFTPRQALTLVTLTRLVREAGRRMDTDSQGMASAVSACLALAIDRLADRICSLATWRPQADQEKVEHIFTRQALPITWDFAEGVPLSEGTAGWDDAVEPPAKLLEEIATWVRHAGQCELASATSHPLPDDSVAVLVTDPPYYDAVPYADLADFFYVWLKRAIGERFPALFSTLLTPKNSECVVNLVPDFSDGSTKDRAFFERSMQQAMGEGRRTTRPDGVGVVVFAHKSTAGWESQLQAMIDAGWTITASWPINTELGNRLRAQNSAALASSIHLACRPRESALVGDWRDVLSELPRRIHDWLPRLAAEGVVGADAIFACLGPALEIFSRYSRVEKASGEVVPLRDYLEHVWAAVAREALAMIFRDADATGFEEDARLTAMWLWTVAAGATNGKGAAEDDAGGDEAAGDDSEDAPAPKKAKASGFSLEYDAARKIAQGLGAHLESLGSLVEVKGETARLLGVAERTRALFGKRQTETAGAKRGKKTKQLALGFDEEIAAAEADGAFAETRAPDAGATVLDRVQPAMILFGSGRGEALKRFLVEGGAGRDERFWRLAQALAALYPSGTEERRWVEGVMARKKGLGL